MNCSSLSVNAIIFKAAYILTMILRDDFHPKQIAGLNQHEMINSYNIDMKRDLCVCC